MRMWEFVYFHFLLFSDIFPMVFHGPLAHVAGWKQGGIGHFTVWLGLPESKYGTSDPVSLGPAETGVLRRAAAVSWFTLKDLTPWGFLLSV